MHLEPETSMNLLDTIIIVAIFFGITLLVHIVICNLERQRGFMFTGLILGGISTFGCIIYMLYIGQFDIIGPYIFFSAWLFYLMVLINLLNSVTLKMLASLYSTPNGILSSQNFINVFNAKDGLETRLSMLKASKFIEQEGEAIKLTPKSNHLLAIIHRVKVVFSID